MITILILIIGAKIWEKMNIDLTPLITLALLVEIVEIISLLSFFVKENPGSNY